MSGFQSGDEILRVENLTTRLAGGAGAAAVDGVSFSVRAGRTLGLVGESGSGKSLTCLSILRLLPSNMDVTGGGVLFKGQDLLKKSPKEMTAVRGAQIGMILQDPVNSINPLFTIGDQVAEVFRHHRGVAGRRALRRSAVDALRQVRIPAAEERIGSYPHQFSGGMRQRVAIGINVGCEPDLLIADEPTTALDVTIRLQILALLRDIQNARAMAMILVTHDLHLVSRFCDDVAVMYGGRIVEYGPVERVFRAPAHPYAKGLIGAAPKISLNVERLAVIPGQPPQAGDHGPGCRFAPRCAKAAPQCFARYPETRRFEDDRRSVACWEPEGSPS